MKQIMNTGIVILALVAIVGCSSPTDGKPDAVVNEAAADAPAATAEAPVAEQATMAAADGVLTFTEESTIGFVGSKVTGSHDGGFKKFSGTVTLDGEDVATAQINVTINMKSTWSDSDRLTKHLKNEDFFDVEKFPESTFVSTGITAEGDAYTVSGDLTLHGVTKNISFPASITFADGVLTANAEFNLNRMDFGIVYAGMADNLIKEDVLMKLNIVAK